ncbi:MAG: hypothetical protein Q7V57_13065 [Actinomycetota bacterium]|nr:hypothetical protein [Actinomycetota bacterium]
MSPVVTFRAGRRLAARLSAVVLALAPLAGGLPTAGAAPALADAERLRLVSQQFDLDSAGVFSAILGVPASIDAATLARATLVVTAYARVDTRNDVTAAIQGDLPRAIDSVELPVSTLPQLAPQQLQVVVPVESLTRTQSALYFARAGLFPVILELTADGNVLDYLLTFVHRLPGPSEPAEVELPIAFGMMVRSPVVVDDQTDVVVDDAALAELTQLADLLEASDVPITVSLSPVMLSSVAEASPEGAALVARLGAALDGDDVLSSPAFPLDASAAAGDGQQSLYTEWLRDGEDLLADLFADPSIRTVVFADRVLSQAGGLLQRDLGARLMVMPAAVYDMLPDSYGVFTDNSQLVRISVGGDVTVPASIIDRGIAEMMSQPTTDPQLTAIHAAAQLLAIRQQIADGGGDPSRHGITIGTADLGLPATEAFAAITSLIAVTDGLDPVTLETLAARTTEFADKGEPVVVNLPPTTDSSIADRVTVMESLRREATSTATMLTTTDGRAADWERVLGMVPSSALTDEQVAVLANELRGEYAAIRSSVEMPTSFPPFTLTGRSSTVPVNVLNTNTMPLTVQIRMTSSKLERQEPQIVTLLPGEYTEVKLKIVARTNGEFGVALEIFTPDGEIRLGPSVPLSVNVRALSGLGNLVTGTLLLVLLTWWARHLRRSRRGEAHRKAARRHPVANARVAEPVASGTPARSPAAEASTLPPS